MLPQNRNLPNDKPEHRVTAEFLDRYGLTPTRQKAYKNLLDESVPVSLHEDTLTNTRKTGHVGRLAVLHAAQILEKSTQIFARAAAAKAFTEESFEEPKHLEFLDPEHILGFNLHTDIFNDSAQSLTADQQLEFLYVANSLFMKSRIANKGSFQYYTLDEWLDKTLRRVEERFSNTMVQGDYKDNKKTLAEAFLTEYNETRLSRRIRKTLSGFIHLGKQENEDTHQDRIMAEVGIFKEQLQKSPRSIATGEIVGALMCLYLAQELD